MAGFKGFGYTSPEEVIAKTQQGFQAAMQSGNPGAMQAAIMQQAAFNIGGSPELRKARKTQDVLTRASKEAGEAGSDIENQIAFATHARKLAEEAGLADVALQARQQLLQLNNMQMERNKLQADTDRTKGLTDYTNTQIESVSDTTFRNKTEVQLLQEQAKIESIVDRLPEDSPQREMLQSNWDMIEYRKKEIAAERERNKKWELGSIEVTGADGTPVIQTIRYNKDNPDEYRVMGEIPLEEYAKMRSGSSGRMPVELLKQADRNNMMAFEARESMMSASRAANAAANIVGAGRGVRGKIRSGFRQIFGTDDLVEVNQRLIDEVVKVRAMGLLPPGPASDKDVKIVMDTQLDSYTNTEAIQASMGAYYRTNARKQVYTQFVDQYLANNQSNLGMQTAFEAYWKENRDAIEAEIENAWLREIGKAPQAAPSQTGTGAVVTGVEVVKP